MLTSCRSFTIIFVNQPQHEYIACAISIHPWEHASIAQRQKKKETGELRIQKKRTKIRIQRNRKKNLTALQQKVTVRMRMFRLHRSLRSFLIKLACFFQKRELIPTAVWNAQS